MFKRFLCLLVVLIFCVGIVGCGHSSAPSETSVSSYPYIEDVYSSLCGIENMSCNYFNANDIAYFNEDESPGLIRGFIATKMIDSSMVDYIIMCYEFDNAASAVTYYRKMVNSDEVKDVENYIRIERRGNIIFVGLCDSRDVNSYREMSDLFDTLIVA